MSPFLWSELASDVTSPLFSSPGSQSPVHIFSPWLLNKPRQMAVPFRPSSVEGGCVSCLYSADSSEVFAWNIASGTAPLTDHRRTNTETQPALLFSLNTVATSAYSCRTKRLTWSEFLDVFIKLAYIHYTFWFQWNFCQKYYFIQKWKLSFALVYATVIFLQVSQPWEVNRGVNSCVYGLYLSSCSILFLCGD